MNDLLKNVLKKNSENFCPVVEFDASTDKLYPFDFTQNNKELTPADIARTDTFSAYVNKKLLQAGARYGIGGYNEDRTIYRRSDLFDGTEARSIHLGVDIWGAEGTKVYVPVGGTVHSYANNNNFGDYGATIILQHQLDTINFYTLYGHLSLADLAPLQEGKYISRGEVLGHFGGPHENGDWPPHLHFQIIHDIRVHYGDYPGVCKKSESKHFLFNCFNPYLILNMMQFV